MTRKIGDEYSVCGGLLKCGDCFPIRQFVWIRRAEVVYGDGGGRTRIASDKNDGSRAPGKICLINLSAQCLEKLRPNLVPLPDTIVPETIYTCLTFTVYSYNLEKTGNLLVCSCKFSYSGGPSFKSGPRAQPS
jgi:hypothetical protein